MDKSEVRVGQVFFDGDQRTANRYIRVDAVNFVQPIAYVNAHRFIDIECTRTKDGRDYPVKIAIARLIKTGTRGYSLVKGVTELVQAEALKTEAAAV